MQLILIILLVAQVFNQTEYYSRKNQALQSGNVLEFVEYSKRLKNEFPREIEVHFGLAEAYLRLNNFSAATSALRDAISIKTDQNVFRRAILLLDNYQRLESEIEIHQVFRRRIHVDTLYAFEVAYLYERLKDYRSAANEILNLLKFSGPTRQLNNSSIAIDRLVNLYKMDKNIALLVNRANLDPQIRKRITGNIYLSDQKYALALSEYLGLHDQGLLLEFAARCREIGLDSLAVVCYERLGLKSDAARVYMKFGDYKKAIDLLTQRKNQEDEILYAECLIKTRRLDEALSLLQAITASKAVYPEAYLLLEDIYLKKNDFGKAVNILSAAAGYVTKDSLPVILYERANLDLFQGRISDATDGYNLLAGRYPRSLLANDGLERLLIIKKSGADTLAVKAYGRILFYSAIDSFYKCIDTTKQFVTRFPGLAQEGYRLLADSYMKIKEYEQALGVIREFEEKMPKAAALAKILLLKASIFIQIREKDKARSTLEQVIMNFGSAPEVAMAREALKNLER